MNIDLASIDPSEFIEFRDKWIQESNLESVADRIFEDAGLSELVELNADQLKEYSNEIGLSIIERKRFMKGMRRLQHPDEPSTPSTPMTPSISNSSSNKSSKTKKQTSKKKITRTNSKKSLKRKRSRSKGNKSTSSIVVDLDHIDAMHDEDSTNATETPQTRKGSDDKDMATLIEKAIEQLQTDATQTKKDIRQNFMDFRTKLTEREMRLLHDVDSTLDKKQRLLQTQLEYVKENTEKNDLCCDPSMSLIIEREDILRTLITAGWVKGASSDNKEEQELQDRERRRRLLAKQQYLTVERLKEVTVFERDCNSKREDSVRLSHEVQEEIEKINVRTKQCETELDAARPVLEEARKLVSNISKKQLHEIRALKKPPAVVEMVMTAVAVMLGNKIKSWRDIQKILATPNFVSSVLEFDTMTLKKKTREQCIKYTKHEDFNETRANKASRVAGPLVKWVLSQIKYSQLLDVVRPMQKEIKVLKKKLDEKQKQLSMCVEVVNQLEVKISQARTDINEMVESMIANQSKYESKDQSAAVKLELVTDDSMKLYKNVSL